MLGLGVAAGGSGFYPGWLLQVTSESYRACFDCFSGFWLRFETGLSRPVALGCGALVLETLHKLVPSCSSSQNYH